MDSRHNRKKQGKLRTHGFTLIELMIVVAIIAIIAAIAVANLTRSRIQANEAAAAGNLRVIAEAQITYHASRSAFAPDFDSLTGVLPPYLSGNWKVPKSGYIYIMNPLASDFSVNADPVEFNVTGTKGFFINSSGVVRFQIGATANAASTPLGTT